MRCFFVPLLLLAFAAGCSLNGDANGGPRTISRGELPGIVLQQADLPRVFVQFDGGPQARADAPQGERADPARFGREAGWKARFRRSGSSSTRGPLVIESRADLFESSEGAGKDLKAVEMTGFEVLREPQLGDEARVLANPTGPAGSVRYFFIVWREDNVSASVFISGFEGKLTLDESLRLARKQQRRMAKAAA